MLSTFDYLFLSGVCGLGFTGFWKRHYGPMWDSIILALAITILAIDLLMH